MLFLPDPCLPPPPPPPPASTQALAYLGTVWSAELKARLHFRPVSRLEDATHVKVVPHAFVGTKEMVALQGKRTVSLAGSFRVTLHGRHACVHARALPDDVFRRPLSRAAGGGSHHQLRLPQAALHPGRRGKRLPEAQVPHQGLCVRVCACVPLRMRLLLLPDAPLSSVLMFTCCTCASVGLSEAK